ncbi:hypothetical protein [Muribaculum intestinale]|uniref:hypothetical protein n=1 Tax=Muribaculum intestinale TaxID=1796646 RepID=UPI0025B65319|nr:hypothetical protein [Muribaculum intestinale]
MKKLIAMMLMLSAILVGCNSEQSKIEKAMKEYVEESFGDPDDFIKVTKIQESPDTIKVSTIIPLVEAADKFANKTINEYKTANAQFEEMEIGLETNAEYISLMGNNSEADKLKKKLAEGKAIFQEGIALSETIATEAKNIQSKYKAETPLYLQYSVSVRQKDADGKKEIETYYARCPYGTEEFKIFTSSTVSNLDELNFKGYSKDPLAKELGKEITELISNLLKAKKLADKFDDLAD